VEFQTIMSKLHRAYFSRTVCPETSHTKLCDVFRVVSLGMQMGRSKVFLRRRVFEALEFLRNIKLGLSAIAIQSHVRRLLAQLQYYDSLHAVVTLQCFVRQKAAKREYIELAQYNSAVKIQCAWRRFLAETEIFAAKLIAYFCQTYRRGAIARELCSILRVEHHALVLQRCWRRHYLESYYTRLRKATVIAQCLWRRKVAIRTVRYLRREAKDVGKIAAERDRFKQESARLKKEVERLKRSKQGHSDPDEDEVERLREEVERLQTVLAKTQGLPVSSIDIAATPETSKSSTKWSLHGFLGKKDDTSTGSQVSTGSYSPMPTIRRAFFMGDRNNSTPINPAELTQRMAEVEPIPSRSRTFNPGVASSSPSLLDTEEKMRPTDDYVYMVPTASTTMGSNPNDSLDNIDLNPAPVSERRGQEFSEELHHLHDVVLANNFQLVKDILRQSDEHHVLINEVGANGRTALHAAVLSSNFKIARILIEKGAIVNTQDFDGDTPLHLAEGAPMTTLLLEEGKANPNIPNIDGICALHIAVQRRDAGSVRMLLQHGAKVDTADNEKWLTPLHMAALPDKTDRVEIVEARMRARTIITNLLCSRNNGSNPDMNDQDHQGNSPLHYAAQIETPEAIDILNVFLEKGADPRLVNSLNLHPLLLLCHNHALRQHDVFQDCLHTMLFHGAEPNKQSTTGCTALHLSLYHRDMDSAVQLVNRGAELHLVWKKVSLQHVEFLAFVNLESLTFLFLNHRCSQNAGLHSGRTMGHRRCCHSIWFWMITRSIESSPR
jgi:ankyrin repeat protein